MNRDQQRRDRRSGGAPTTAAAMAQRRSLARTPAVEPLEGRQLLSNVYSGATAIRPVMTTGGMYTITMNGPGLVNVNQLGRGVVGLKLYGTTPATTVAVALTQPRLHLPAVPLQIGSIKVVSGQLGGITAGAADLLGTVTPLNGQVTSLQFGSIRSNARIDINGSLGSLSVESIDLGPNGHVRIAGDLAKGLAVTGPMSVDGGLFVVGHDLAGTSTIGGSFSVTDHGLVSVGQDIPGILAVTGDLNLASKGTLSVGRDLNILTVNGNVNVDPSGGEVVVGGNLNAFVVNGYFQGNGTPAPDLSVGLNLRHLIVTGGGADKGGLRNASIDVAKCIQVSSDPADPYHSFAALDVQHGIFDSLITAGVCIDGVNVGPDGVIALQNSQLLAGVSIRNLGFQGDVVSDFPTNPSHTGYPTRIIAGELRSGKFNAGADVTNLAITGALVDSVIAASVQPYGGDGSLPPAVPYGGLPRQPAPPPGQGDAGYNTYDAPGGVTGTGANAYKNYSELSFPGSGPPVVTWDTNADPTIDDNILPRGVISNVTVSGGVISTPRSVSEADKFDFTGVLAETTQGVQGGKVPGP
jgi:hypothetical protein